MKSLPFITLGLVATLALTCLVAFAVMASYDMISHDHSVTFGMMNHDGMGGMMSTGGQDTSNTSPTRGATAESVEIQDFAYTPGNLEVPVGATVTWTNYDDAPHTATDVDGSWDTGMLNKGESASVTFDQPGDFTYYCVVHPDMKARIRVG